MTAQGGATLEGAVRDVLPKTTYRVQLGPGLTFDALAARASYLADLGITTMYCSPVTEAVPESTHGYDGTDPSALRAELGGEEGFATLCCSAEQAGLGICIDIVPNHLATWPGGPWWRRLLAEGPGSEMAEVFDVDWPAGDNKVLLPLLDRPLDEALAGHGLRLALRGGEVVLEIGALDLPIANGTARVDDDLAEVLGAQHYRLVDWHEQGSRNYRRFFDIDGLVGVHVERPEVFERTHALVIDLAHQGRLAALRVDHVDGLRDPESYLRRLAAATQLPIFVEKVLTGDEMLRRSWPVAGTTGYEVIDDIGGALVEPAGLARLRGAARAEGEEPVAALSRATRRLVARTSFAGELERVAGRLGLKLAELVAVVVELDRYRSYLPPLNREAEPEDVACWQDAARHAGVPEVASAILDPTRREAVLDLQQLTGAIMAKGLEDTAYFRLAGPLAFCEVGGDPARDRRNGVERLWHRATARAADGRTGLVPGTTHDTKHAADVRARLCGLSELAEGFEAGLAAFRARLGLGRDGGSLAHESRLLAEILLALWPPLGLSARAEGRLGDATASIAELRERVAGFVIKSAREAKQHSSWQAPDERYESSLVRLVEESLADDGDALRSSFGSICDEVARLGALNALAMVVLEVVLPGIPNCYQGDEVWNFSLVDPDNRRGVDFERLASALSALEPAPGGRRAQLRALRRSWRDGKIKLALTTCCLHARRDRGDALAPDAPVHALATTGPAASHVLALARRGASGRWVVGVVTRNGGALASDPADLPAAQAYANSRLRLGAGAPTRLVEAVSGRHHLAERGELALDDLLADAPVALLLSEPQPAERQR